MILIKKIFNYKQLIYKIKNNNIIYNKTMQADISEITTPIKINKVSTQPFEG